MANCRKCGRNTFFFQLKKGLCCNCIREIELQQEQATRTHHEQASVSPPVEAEPVVIQKTATNNSTQPEVIKPAPPITPAPKEPKTYRVTGVQHYMDNLMRLAVLNSDYAESKRALIDMGYTDERIWKYEFFPTKAELVPEPDNPHDPKAIKVVVDEEHVGYIKAGSCAHLHKVLRENRIEKIECEIFGGDFKRIDEDYDYDRDKEVYTLERGNSPYMVNLHITEQ